MGIYGGFGGGPKAQKMSEIDNFADFGPHSGGVDPLEIISHLKSLPFCLKYLSVFKYLCFDTSFVMVGPFFLSVFKYLSFDTSFVMLGPF